MHSSNNILGWKTEKRSLSSCFPDTVSQSTWWPSDVMKWKHFPRYWPFVRGIHRSPVDSPHKGQWRGALMFFDLRLNIRMSKQCWGWWFETPSRPLWRHCNDKWTQGQTRVLWVTKTNFLRSFIMFMVSVFSTYQTPLTNYISHSYNLTAFPVA